MHKTINTTSNMHIKLGEGGFGSVYKGILSNGMAIAVRDCRKCLVETKLKQLRIVLARTTKIAASVSALIVGAIIYGVTSLERMSLFMVSQSQLQQQKQHVGDQSHLYESFILLMSSIQQKRLEALEMLAPGRYKVHLRRKATGPKPYEPYFTGMIALCIAQNKPPAVSQSGLPNAPEGQQAFYRTQDPGTYTHPVLETAVIETLYLPVSASQIVQTLIQIVVNIQPTLIQDSLWSFW
ncbi:hypothetical protein KIW84_051948 [Lathyrus oleraceus]|uniref:Protein kinase domain-containing protein n=1 Tax=Pisum sativum TaxID=3888 RepID=A0A9D4WME3_PEA|nr:hypothetical protein KIW84_051948 [Pisum sativum]